MVTDSHKLIDIFRNARAHKISWEKLVRALSQLEEHSLTDEKGRSWARVAAQLSGYSVNQLRQMQRTWAALEELHSKTKKLTLASSLLAFPFSHLEIIARIAKLDSDAAIRYLRSAGTTNKPPAYRELRKHFYTLRDETPQEASPIAAGLKTARQFEDLCLKLLKQDHAAKLYPSEALTPEKCLERHIKRWPGAFRYASPDLLIESRLTGDSTQIDAADCFTLYGDIAQEETIRRIRRVAFEASFFPVFWMMLPNWSPCTLFASECETLELRNVGVVEVNPERGTVKVVKHPNQRTAKHDRARLLRGAMSSYLHLK
jgi:hypothetical protein